jgi:hypothetical protein
LIKTEVQYEFASGSSKGSGYNYFSGKDESFTIEAGDLMVHSQQPRSAMIKVLFEPKSKLVDSNTYDITAWSLPYGYGLNTFASKNKLQSSAGASPVAITNNVSDAYGYVISWKGLQSVKSFDRFNEQGSKSSFLRNSF